MSYAPNPMPLMAKRWAAGGLTAVAVAYCAAMPRGEHALRADVGGGGAIVLELHAQPAEWPAFQAGTATVAQRPVGGYVEGPPWERVDPGPTRFTFMR